MEREGDCDFDPDAMKSSRDTQSLKQGLQRGSNIQDSYHDNSYDTLQKTPWKRTFHLHSQSMDYQNFKGGSGVSLRLEMTKRPASPSPQDNNQHGNDTPSSASLSFSFFSPRTSFAQSELQRCSLGEEVAGSTRTTINEEKEGIPSTFNDARKSTSVLLVNPRRAPAPMSFKEEICPQLRIQQGYSVRRANLPRRYSHSEPHIVLPEETHDRALELPKIEVVQPDPGKDQDSNASNASKNSAKEPGKDQDSNASNASKNAATDPENSSEGFESSIPVENFHLPATKEEENLKKNDTSIEVLSGTGSNGSYSKPTNEEVDVGEERNGLDSTANIKRSSVSMTRYDERRDEREAETIALQGATRARDLDRLKRSEEKIMAWERKQIAKANEHMKNFERKLEKKRAKEIWKTQKKIARAHKKAENRKAAKRIKFEAESVGVSSLAKRIRSGKLLWKCYFF